MCSLDYKKVVKIGNILKNNIVDIWNNEVMKRYQEGQNDINKLKKLDLCNKCIRGGRYLLNEDTLTKLITKKIENPIAKQFYKIFASNRSNLKFDYIMKIGLINIALELYQNKKFRSVKSILDMGSKELRVSYDQIKYAFDQTDIKFNKKKFEN